MNFDDLKWFKWFLRAMGLRTWLKGQLGFAASRVIPDPGAVDLVSGESQSEQFAPPVRAGIDAVPRWKPWSVSRLESIFRACHRHPSQASLLEGRLARHCLSSFWLMAPVDQLESLYSGPIGVLHRQQMDGPLPHQALAADEQQWCDLLQKKLVDPECQAQHLNLLLALMPYFGPGNLITAEPLVNLPNWLLKDYVMYCEPELKAELEGPAGLLEPSEARSSGSPSTNQSVQEWTPLTSRRGEEAMEWFGNEEALDRMKALLNLYALDPNDQETIEELAALRRVAAQLWLDVDPAQVQALYQTPVGLLTRSLVTSGFGAVVHSEVDQRARQLLPAMAADLSQPRAVNALLALLVFYPPGKVTVNNAHQLPDWLLEELKTF